MDKLFFSKKKHKVDDIHKDITLSFLTWLSSKKDLSNSDVGLSLVNGSIDACMELFRHSLCICLDLDSTLSYKELDSLVSDCTEALLNGVVKDYDLLSKSVDYKKGVLESCMHCIVMSRNQARGF